MTPKCVGKFFYLFFFFGICIGCWSWKNVSVRTVKGNGNFNWFWLWKWLSDISVRLVDSKTWKSSCKMKKNDNVCSGCLYTFFLIYYSYSLSYRCVDVENIKLKRSIEICVFCTQILFPGNYKMPFHFK